MYDFTPLDFGIVDAHLHIWDPRNLRYLWLDGIPALNRPFLPEDYETACGGVKVDKMVFMQCECSPGQRHEEVSWVMGQAARDPRLKGIVPFVPLEMGGGAEGELDGLSKNGMVKGVRRIIQFEPDLEFCLKDSFAEGVRLLPKYGFTFDICIDRRHNKSIIKFLEKVPGVACVLDHIGKPDIKNGELEPWRTEMKAIASFPNVWCKVSSLATEADWQNWTLDDLKPFVDCIFENFGFSRTIFAGDWPVSSQAAPFPACVGALLELVKGAPRGELYKLFRGNAEEVYRV